jgi:hypothetical protein
MEFVVELFIINGVIVNGEKDFDMNILFETG